MKLTVFNGSGRGKTGNTQILLDAFLEGFSSVEGNTVETHILMPGRNMDACTAAFASAENVLMVFPMYTDMVPGVVKALIETLQPYCGREGNPSIGFIIHCGFPEGVQLRALERYLEKLSRRLGCRHTGTVLKGNSEGLRESSPKSIQKYMEPYRQLGRSFALNGVMDQTLIADLAKPERMPGFMLFTFRHLMGLFNTGWDTTLKKNGVFQRRFDKPYAED